MSILGLIVVICVLGALAWLVSRAPMIPPTFKNICYFVLVLIALIVCANAFGLLGSLHQPVPKL